MRRVCDIVWGIPTVFLIIFTGFLISIKTRFVQIRKLPAAILLPFKKQQGAGGKNMSPLQSACTALSATMGTGNIAGVAGAVALGGAGAVFWMWISAIFSMAVKYAEIYLSTRYRIRDRKGEFHGGTAYIIDAALPRKFHFLAVCFSACGAVASFGIGNLAQISTVSSSAAIMIKRVLPLSQGGVLAFKLAIGALCAALVFKVITSGSNKVGALCEKIVPVMTILYLALSAGVLIAYRENLPQVLKSVFVGAFSPKAVSGGVVGSVFVCMRIGMSRGVFSNEAGLGTAPTVYSCSDGDNKNLPLFGVFEVFLDTVVCCTLTALVVLSAGNISYGTDIGAATTFSAFAQVYGENVIFIFCPLLCCFAFSSILGWGFYGVEFMKYLTRSRRSLSYLTLFCFTICIGAIIRVDAVWLISEILNGLMILPNITALLLLSKETK